MASFTSANTECYVTLQKEKSEEIDKAANDSKRPHAQLIVGLCLGCLLAIVVIVVVGVVVFTVVLRDDVADSGWGSWTACSRTCGKAKGRQTRTCTNPARKQCQGESERECEAFSCSCDTSMKVGATVVRNDIDWKYRDQDGGLGNKGKVLKLIHSPSPGWITVKWENDHENQYRWGADGKNDVKIYCEDGCATSMKVGSKVVRDDVDWIHGDQDGGPGSFGTIARKEVQKLHVTWNVNGKTHSYRWGKHGETDVKPYCPKFL